MLIPVFDKHICLYDYEKFSNFKGKDQISKNLDDLFSLSEVINEPNVEDAKGGRALSSAHLQSKHILNMPGFKESDLCTWVMQQLLRSAIELGISEYRDVRKFKFHRTWANKMYENCDAIAHRHAVDGQNIPHIVGILYWDVPEHSADLIFIDDGNTKNIRGDRYFDYELEKQYRIAAQPGRLVCHDAKFLHATSVHKSDLPRTCMIFEVGFPPLEV